MKLLNVGAGGTRPQGDEWTNIDQLHDQLRPGTPERRQLDAEKNYINHDITKGLPFADESFDGVLNSHCAEHFDPQAGVQLLKECRRVLKPGCALLVSVPDASIFRRVDAEDRNENWPRLFGVTDPNNPIPTWRTASLFFEQHRMVFTEDSLWCFLREAGFGADEIFTVNNAWLVATVEFGSKLGEQAEALLHMTDQLNRLQESLIMSATK